MNANWEYVVLSKVWNTIRKRNENWTLEQYKRFWTEMEGVLRPIFRPNKEEQLIQENRRLLARLAELEAARKESDSARND